MPTLEEQFSLLLHNSANAYKQALNRRLKYLGVGQAGWLTIALIAKSRKALSQIELAQLAGVEPPSMVAMLDRLTELNFVKRLPSTSDRRMKLIALTAEGAALYVKIKKEADLFRAELLSCVKKNDLQKVVPILEKIYQAAEVM
jgi:MarR family transcriptional regulator for hemolysin